MQAAITNPKTALATAAGYHPVPAVPAATARTDSPSTIRVKSP